MLVPHGGLLLIVEECAMRLQSCATIVAELETPRPKHVEDTVRLALMSAARECWLGLFEATALESKLAKNSFNDSEPYSFEDFEESRKALDKIRADFVRSEEATMSPSAKDTSERANQEARGGVP